jgi:hypothetical protein
MVKLAHPKSAASSSRHPPTTLVRDAARALWVDRWVSYPRAERILSRLDDLMYLPARVRMQNVLIHGNSGAGKSMIIEKFIRSHSLELDREDAARPIEHANAAASHASERFLGTLKIARLYGHLRFQDLGT